MQPGTIVTLRRFGDPLALWTIAERIIGHRARYRVIRENREGRRFGHDVSAGDVVMIAEPAFTPGQQLRHNGRTVEVIEANGDMVRIAFHAPYQTDGGEVIDFGTRHSNVPRADLVAQNIRSFTS